RLIGRPAAVRGCRPRGSRGESGSPRGLLGEPIMESARAGDGTGGLQQGHLGLPSGTLDAVLAGSPDLVFLCDRGGTFLYANVAGARQWGRERREILGMSWR